MLEILAVCHTVIVEKKDGKIFYNASSPDELALVNAAKFFKYTFTGRDEEDNVLIDCKGDLRRYKLLNLIEFTSTRKRMTVIVRTEDKKIRVMCKGADSIIIPRLNKQNSLFLDITTDYLDSYAKEGLRTLLLAEKEITEEYYREWKSEYDKALVAPTASREDMIN